MTDEQIIQAIKKGIEEALPKQWLSKKDLATEFGIQETTVWRIINDAEDPLPYSTLGHKKQLFNRDDINAYLERRKRNVI